MTHSEELRDLLRRAFNCGVNAGRNFRPSANKDISARDRLLLSRREELLSQSLFPRADALLRNLEEEIQELEDCASA